MGRSVVILLAGSVLFAGAAQSQESPTPTVITTGTGQVSLPPTKARLFFESMAHAPTAEAASRANDDRLARLLAALRAAPTVDSLRVRSIRVSPREDDEGKVLGFEANATLELIVQDLASLNAVLDAAVRGGASGLGQARFEVDSTGPARREALRRAGAAARADAEALAAAFGHRLGPLLTVSTSAYLPFGTNAFEEASVETGFSGAAFGNAQSGIIRIGPTPSEVVVSATVTTRWQLAP